MAAYIELQKQYRANCFGAGQLAGFPEKAKSETFTFVGNDASHLKS
jgi:hypothetical protein